MVRNPESKPRSSFGDRLRRLRAFGEKTLAIIGMASTAIVGVGCNNSEVNDPNSNITPDTVATDTQAQEIPPSPEPRNTEPPSPEVKLKGVDELAKTLDNLKDSDNIGAIRGAFSKFIEENSPEGLKTNPDENGIMYIEDPNDADAVKKIGRQTLYGLKLVFELLSNKNIPLENRLSYAELYTRVMTAGQAKNVLETITTNIAKDGDKGVWFSWEGYPEEGPSGLPEVIAEASMSDKTKAKNGNTLTTTACRDGSEEDPFTQNGANRHGCLPAWLALYVQNNNDGYSQSVIRVLTVNLMASDPADLNHEPQALMASDPADLKSTGGYSEVDHSVASTVLQISVVTSTEKIGWRKDGKFDTSVNIVREWLDKENSQGREHNVYGFTE